MSAHRRIQDFLVAALAAAPILTDGGVYANTLDPLPQEVDSQIVVRLRFDTRQRPDVVLMEKGGWLSAGRCANALIRGEETDAGGCAVYHDTPVRLLPIGPS